MHKLTLALSTAALAMSGTALAQTAPTSSAKARAPMAADMTRAQAQAKAEAAFAKMDANKDGTLDESDRAARHTMMFDRMDTDRNGAISRAEFDAMHAKRAEGRGDKGRMGGKMNHDGMNHDGMNHDGMMGGKMGAMMGKADGPITRQAFVERALGMFDKADANRDGTVTQTERKSMRDTMRKQMQASPAARQQD